MFSKPYNESVKAFTTRHVYCSKKCKDEAMKGNSIHFIHGHARASGVSPEYKAWVHMRDRCYNPKNKDYHNYGGRGVMVCEQWRDSFESFLEHVGLKPDWATGGLDRINNETGHYEPGNVRWATKKQQNNNRRAPSPETIQRLTEMARNQAPPSDETREKWRQAMQNRPRDAKGRMMKVAA